MAAPSAPVQGEREAFEAALAGKLDFEPAGLLRKSEGSTYWQVETETCWRAWQRMLATPQPAAQEAPREALTLSDEQIRALMPEPYKHKPAPAICTACARPMVPKPPPAMAAGGYAPYRDWSTMCECGNNSFTVSISSAGPAQAYTAGQMLAFARAILATVGREEQR